MQVRCERLQPRQRKREEIASLVRGKGVHFINHHALQPAKQLETVRIGEQQRQALRRGQEDVRRAAALPLLTIGRRVAAARFDPQRQAHLFDRSQEIALDIMRKSLER